MPTIAVLKSSYLLSPCTEANTEAQKRDISCQIQTSHNYRTKDSLDPLNTQVIVTYLDSSECCVSSPTVQEPWESAVNWWRSLVSLGLIRFNHIIHLVQWHPRPIATGSPHHLGWAMLAGSLPMHLWYFDNFTYCQLLLLNIQLKCGAEFNSL